MIRYLKNKLHGFIITSKLKELVLLRCGHLFSTQLMDNLSATRNRKCLICGETLGKDEV